MPSSSEGTEVAASGDDRTPEAPGSRPRSLHHKVQLLVAMLVAGVYARTLHPTIQGGDSGELATEGCTFGIAHPPGYPLLTLIGNVLSRLPTSPGTSTVKLTNLFNAGVSALAAVMLYRVATEITGKSGIACWTAGAAAIAYAFSPLIWLYAIGNEVFALNQFFAASLLYLVLRYAVTGSPRCIAWGAFLCGLALCNQHTIVLFEAPAIAWIVWTQYRSGVLTVAKLRNWAGLFFLGLAPYLYLPIAHSLNPRPGGWGNPSSLSGFWRHITRADYGTFKLYGYGGRETPGAAERTFEYAKDFATEQAGPLLAAFAVVGLAVAVLGVAPRSLDDGASVRGGTSGASSDASRRAAGLPVRSPPGALAALRAVTGVWAAYLLVFHSLSNTPLDEPMFFGVHARFWQQPNIVAFLLVAVGMCVAITRTAAVLFPASPSAAAAATASASTAVPAANTKAAGGGTASKAVRKAAAAKARAASSARTKGAASKAGSRTSTRWVQPSLRGMQLGTYVSVVVAVAVAVLCLQSRYHALDMHDNDYVARYGRATLNALPPNALIITADDLKWGSLQYAQHCEQFRLDVTVLSAPVMSYAWFDDQRKLFPGVHFPGKRLGITRSKAFVTGEVFSLKTFIDANVGSRPVFFDGKIGGYTTTDATHEAAYDFRPAGLTKQALPKGSLPVPVHVVEAEWKLVRDFLLSPPDTRVWTAESWENAVAHMYWKSAVELVTYLINSAGSEKAAGRASAPYLLMAARLMDQFEGSEDNQMVAKSWRDLGLIYYGLATEHGLPSNVTSMLVPFVSDDGATGTAAADTEADWRILAHRRAAYAWSTYLAMPESQADAERQTLVACVKFSRSAIQRHDELAAVAQAKARGDSTSKPKPKSNSKPQAANGGLTDEVQVVADGSTREKRAHSTPTAPHSHR